MDRLAHRYPAELLDAVFGKDSKGIAPTERARSSARRFVRSQVQLAFASPSAKGRILTAYEALQTFGWETLRRVATDGAATLVRSAEEPSSTLRSQRVELGITPEELSKQTGVSQSDILNAETPGNLTSIRTLEKLGQALALDERRLGYQPNAGRDTALGVRLRELRQAADTTIFGPRTVLDLSEAAWVIARQDYLSKALGLASPTRIELPAPNANYSYPAYRIGYELAERTRELLGYTDEQPIDSLRALIEEVLELPLVQQRMDDRFAGATIANGNIRGIVINERGMNSNVWVRRMTLCHEVGHVLWDPDTYLSKLKVDEYAEVEGDISGYHKTDPVEIRANAFAVSFLAPPSGVRRIAEQCHENVQQILAQVMSTYGISGSAARHHVHNITQLETASVPISSLPHPTEDWIAQEELSISYFPIQDTPITRRGKFAWFVAKMLNSGMLSEDTASAYLKCNTGETSAHLQTILSMWPDGVDRSQG
ncbi:XRE family transcriptional regulator [Variovorax paradoxus]|uniref:XRE family transcriptional regulator n=1 Tax=Variovorax paradoxus TaxID=34073 RepID=UPI0012BB65DA|nr:XRE family transcriptional regulator [Variovorax paradoxus]